MLRHNAFPGGVTREGLLEWYRAARARTRSLFDIVAPEAYYDRPIALRNPIVFYEGHLPGFCVNTLVKLALKRNGVDDRLEALFARGIDPEDEASIPAANAWPARDAVQQFASACDELVEDALRNGPLEDDDVPELRGGAAVFTILEHEAMHQETLLYLLHQLPDEKKRRPAAWRTGTPACPLPERTGTKGIGRSACPPRSVAIPAGSATLGGDRGSFGWDNEFPAHRVHVDAFTVDVYNVTNGDWLEFMEATRASAPQFWERVDGEWCFRGMFECMPLMLDAPVYVTHSEAEAYARWKGKRLPTEGEFHRAAYGTPEGDERAQPWGDSAPDSTRGNFDFNSLHPVPVGSYPDAASAWGVHDLVGNGWEWTSTIFEGFAGFEAMPAYLQYSSDFFDRAHYVMKGASPVTARELVRRSFRNWFRPNYPYVYATFRCVA